MHLTNEPEAIVLEALEHINTGKILDLGSGEGRHALLLAEKGFDVHAVDISEDSIKKLRKEAESRGLSIKAEVADLTKIKLDDFYDMVICSYINHHLSTNESMYMIDEIKTHTNKDGLNVIAAITKNNDFSGEEMLTDRYFPETQELNNLYKDWKVIEYREEEPKTKIKKGKTEDTYDLAAFIIAQKQ